MCLWGWEKIAFIRMFGVFLLVLYCTTGATFAEKSPPNLYVNGTLIRSGEVLFVEGGRTMVPLRMVANVLDLDVRWNQKTSTAVLKDGKSNVFEIKVGEKTAYKNKKPIRMDSAAVMRHSRVYVPLKFIATGFSHTVDYDAKNHNVIIDGNYTPPLDRGTMMYEYATGIAPEVIAEKKSAPFQSIAVSMKNPVLKKGIRWKTGGAFLDTYPNEFLEIRKDENGGTYFFHLHSKEMNELNGQIFEEFYAGLKDGFLEAVIFDLGADKENELILIAGDESGFRMLPFVIGLQEDKSEGYVYGMVYPLVTENGGYVKGEYALFYDPNGTIRIYEGNGGAYRILSQDESGYLRLSELQW